MHDLRVTIVQPDLHWESIDANLAMLEEKIWQIDQPTDVIVLPETFTTGFSMHATSLAEHMNMRTTRWMGQMADQTRALIMGSIIAKEGNAYYNRLVSMKPGGNVQTYDKRHLFRMGEEDGIFTSGNDLLIVEWKGWKICPLVCYDLRFPVWSRNRWSQEAGMLYDVLVYVANWPKSRIQVWSTLLEARAIENQCYVVGANRIGTDNNNIEYNGQSSVFGPKGELIFGGHDEEFVKTVEFKTDSLRAFRKKFPVYLDADQFEISPKGGLL